MKSIALMIETSRTYGREILDGVRDYLSETNTDWSVTVELRDLQSPTPAWLKHWNGDGIICRTGSRSMGTAIRRLAVPTVELRSAHWNPDAPFVGIDNELVGALAANHLLERNLRHFAVYGLRTESFFITRIRSFQAELRRNGFDCHRYEQTGQREKPSQWEKQQRDLVAWLHGLPKPSGILACTDQLGCWLLDACRRAKLIVPDQIAVMGVENDETLCTLSDPPMTSIRLGGQRVGFRAAELMSRMLRRRKVSTSSILLPPSGVIPRRSSDLIAVEDSLLAKAIRAIREHACDGLTVDDMAVLLDCSRSTLERRFRHLLGRSPNEEIVRARLSAACELLRSTNQSLQSIAEQCNLGSASYLSKQFRGFFKETPGEYRRRHRA